MLTGAHYMQHVIRLLKDKEGVTVFEYGVISFLISLAAIIAVISLEASLITLFPA